MLKLTSQSIGRSINPANIGWSRDLEPVPKTGKIRFSQIGNLTNVRHENEKGIDLSEQRYQQMIGNLTPVTPIDPEAWRGAIWYQGTNINRGEDLPPPNPDAWNEAYINNWEGSLSTTVYDAEKDAMFVQAQAPGRYNNNTMSALVYYVGKLPAGARIKVSCYLRAQNQADIYEEPIYLHIRGWANGWFSSDGSDVTQDWRQYIEWKHGSWLGYGRWFAYEDEFTVANGWQDIWVALEANSPDPNDYPKTFNMGWVRNLKIELA